MRASVNSDSMAAWSHRVAELQRQLRHLTPEQLEQLNRMPVDFLAVIEAFQVAAEEMRQQHEELLLTRERADLERQRYEDLFLFAPDAYIVTDQVGQIQQANHSASLLINRPLPQLVGRPMSVLFPLGERRELRRKLLEVAREPGLHTWESRMLVGGQNTPIAIVLTVSNAPDRVSGQPSLRWMIRNITRRKQLESALLRAQTDLEAQVEKRTGELAEANALLEMIFESALDFAILSLDLDNRITSWNAGAERLFGYTTKEIIGQSGAIIFTPEDRAAGAVEEEVETARTTGKATDERWKQRKDGSRFFASGTMRPMYGPDGTHQGYVKIARDMTRRLREEEAQRLAHERAVALAALEERQRLARDLHDVVSQTLYSASIIAQSLPRLWPDAPPAVREQFEHLGQLNMGALAELRMLLAELHPAMLVRTDLGELMRHLAASAQARKHIAIKVSVEGNHALPENVHVTLYRIAQEAMNNIIKHAQAADAAITLERAPGRVALTVRDSGQGFDPDEACGGFGMESMRERAAGIGAQFQVDSAPGKGTTVRVVWTAPT